MGDYFLESIKVIRLRTASGGHYLAAHRDQQSLSIYKPIGSLPENTKWEVTWLGGGKCCFKSIYGKVFTVRRGWFTAEVYQEPWSMAGDYGSFYLQVTNQNPKSDREFHAKLVLGNESSYTIEANDYAVFLSSTSWSSFRSMSSGWIVEVVERRESNKQQLEPLPIVVGNVSFYNSGYNVNYGPGSQTNGHIIAHNKEKAGKRDVGYYTSKATWMSEHNK